MSKMIKYCGKIFGLVGKFTRTYSFGKKNEFNPMRLEQASKRFFVHLVFLNAPNVLPLCLQQTLSVNKTKLDWLLV